MTEEQRNLLMKDISSRLQHGVKVQVYQQGLQEYDNYWNVWSLDKESQEVSGVLMYGVTLDCMAMRDGVIPFEFIKPYLLPLSSMTDEQKREYNSLCYFVPSRHYEFEDMITDTIDYLIANHFDYRGLIQMGLALDATGRNIY